MSFRDDRHIFIIIGMWDDLKDDDNNIHWVRQFWNTINSISSGGNYVNYDADTGIDRVKAAYGPQKYERLVSLKNKYDPDNFFSLNQNIKSKS